MLKIKANNTPVATLVLHEVVGGGDHLPSDDSYARLPFLFNKKYKKLCNKI